jgi:hypothetical protein
MGRVFAPGMTPRLISTGVLMSIKLQSFLLSISFDNSDAVISFIRDIDGNSESMFRVNRVWKTQNYHRLGMN